MDGAQWANVIELLSACAHATSGLDLQRVNLGSESVLNVVVFYSRFRSPSVTGSTIIYVPYVHQHTRFNTMCTQIATSFDMNCYTEARKVPNPDGKYSSRSSLSIVDAGYIGSGEYWGMTSCPWQGCGKTLQSFNKGRSVSTLPPPPPPLHPTAPLPVLLPTSPLPRFLRTPTLAELCEGGLHCSSPRIRMRLRPRALPVLDPVSLLKNYSGRNTNKLAASVRDACWTTEVAFGGGATYGAFYASSTIPAAQAPGMMRGPMVHDRTEVNLDGPMGAASIQFSRRRATSSLTFSASIDFGTWGHVYFA
ncbi:hypothetical protein BDQ17DRAFT_1415168, partial [Cyathus striatus]